jgi:phage gp36-like protein
VAYASLQKLIDRFGDVVLTDLTDRDETATGNINTDIVDRALTDTDAVINGYLATRYALPISETPVLVVDLALSIAIYKLHVFAPDPKIEEEYKQALRTLRDISTGAMRLEIAGVEPGQTGGSGAKITDRERPMTADNLKGFI